MRALIIPSVALAVCAGSVRAEPVTDFYRGKTLDLVIGAAAGGGYDLAGRTLAAHLGRHLLGNPTVVVRTMPGAGGLVLANYLFNAAKRDGTAIGMPTSNVPMEPRLRLLSPDGSGAKFDIARMNWIGTPLQEPQVTWVWHTVPARTIEDLKRTPVLMGATTAAADNSILPLLVNQLLGTRMQVVTGYLGQNEINLAVERGEVQGNNTGLSNLTVNKAEWLRDDKVRVLLQFGDDRLPALKDVPTVVELATTAEDRALFRFYALKFRMARPLAMPPDVPADRVAAVRSAFEATMRDADYLAEARRIGLDVNWIGGEEISHLIRDVAETPQPVIDRLRDLLARAGGK